MYSKVGILKKNVLGRHISDDSSDVKLFYSAMIFVTALPNKGGCCDRQHVHQKKTVHKNMHSKIKQRTIKLISPKSSNNNCLFVCFTHFLKIKGNTLNLPKLRKQLGFDESSMIDVKDIKKVADHFKCSYILLNQNEEILQQNEIVDYPLVHIMLLNEHYYIVDSTEYNQCKECGKSYLSNSEHKCNNKRVSFYNICKLKQKEYVAMTDPSDENKINIDDMIFFDLETFQETICHIPYACGYSYGDHKMFI